MINQEFARVTTNCIYMRLANLLAIPLRSTGDTFLSYKYSTRLFA